MLMMLAGSGSWCRDSAADARDAGRVGESCGRASPAAAHDAGGVGVEIAQLMLMMLCVGSLGEEPAQLMLIMLAGFGSQPS